MAVEVAVKTVAQFLKENEDKFDLVAWVLFDERTKNFYDAEIDKLKE